MKPAERAWKELGWEVAGALFAIAVILGGIGLFLRGENTRGHNPCGIQPAGKSCAQQREAVARAEPIRNPCISYQRVTSRRGKNCPRRFDAQPPRGGDAIQTPSPKGHQQHPPSSKGGGGGSGKGGVGGGKGPSAPGQGGSDGASAPQGPSAGGQPARGNPAPAANEAAQSQQPNLPATVEATGKAAGEAVEGVGKAAEGAVCRTVEAPGCSK